MTRGSRTDSLEVRTKNEVYSHECSRDTVKSVVDTVKSVVDTVKSVVDTVKSVVDRKNEELRSPSSACLFSCNHLSVLLVHTTFPPAKWVAK